MSLRWVGLRWGEEEEEAEKREREGCFSYAIPHPSSPPPLYKHAPIFLKLKTLMEEDTDLAIPIIDALSNLNIMGEDMVKSTLESIIHSLSFSISLSLSSFR